MVLGITGISGAGKHTAAEFLAKKGWVVLDADTMAHALYRPYTGVWKALVAAFGEGILNKDDTINRQTLGKKVFDPKDPAGSERALETLDGIVHPYLRRRLEEEIRFQSKKGVGVAVVAALWKELGLASLCEKIMLVEARPDIRSERIQRRDGISKEMYEVRIRGYEAPQKPDFRIGNNGAPEELLGQLTAALGLR